MKKQFTFLAIALFLSVMAFSQQPQREFNAEKMAERQTEMMVKELSLTPEQTEKVKALNIETSEKMGEMIKTAGDDREGMREKRKTLHEESDVKLKTILTEEQYTKYVELQKERVEQRKLKQPDRRGSQRGTKETK